MPRLEALEDRAVPSTFTVENLADSGPGSLRQAVLDANTLPGDDTIDFSVTGTINLASALPNLSTNIDIQGPGAASLTVRRSTAAYYRIFTVGGGTTVSIVGLTIANGVAYFGAYGGGILNQGTLTLSDSTLTGNFGGTNGGGIYNAGMLTVNNSTLASNEASSDGSAYGGGIYNAGTLTVRNSTFSHNGAAPGGVGGAIYNDQGTVTVTDSIISGNGAEIGGGICNDRGTMTVNNSTISGNGSQGGGGIYNYEGTLLVINSTFSSNFAFIFYGPGDGGGIYNSGTLTVRNSTLSGNSAEARGGGIYNGGDYPSNYATLTVSNSTITGNAAQGVRGGGIYSNYPFGTILLHLRNTILAGNTVSGAGAVGPDLDGPLTSSSYNLIGNTSGGSGFAPTDFLNVDPLLGPLRDNGGPTFTHALLAGSPALDAGDNTDAPATDQRGFARVVGSAIDIGAYEAQHIIDDGDAGFNATPGFFPFSGQGYQDDVHYAEAGGGSETATWTFTGLAPGLYRVSATWSEHPNRASNAPFTVLDGTAELGTVRVNQEQAPGHFNDNGRPWFNLGGVYPISSGTLVVRLSNDADEYIIADAVRIEQLTASPVQVRDDGDPGFLATDGFFAYLGQGYQDDVTFAGPGSGTQAAAWIFAVVPGTYRISATWTAHPNRATDAPFFLFDGSTLVGAVSVNQELAPDDFSANGSLWEDLGSGIYTITGDTLTVVLTDLADEYVIADAIRIERVA